MFGTSLQMPQRPPCSSSRWSNCSRVRPYKDLTQCHRCASGLAKCHDFMLHAVEQNLACARLCETSFVQPGPSHSRGSEAWGLRPSTVVGRISLKHARHHPRPFLRIWLGENAERGLTIFSRVQNAVPEPMARTLPERGGLVMFMLSQVDGMWI